MLSDYLYTFKDLNVFFNLFNFLNCENFSNINSGPKPIRIIKKYLKDILKLKRLKFAWNWSPPPISTGTNR